MFFFSTICAETIHMLPPEFGLHPRRTAAADAKTEQQAAAESYLRRSAFGTVAMKTTGSFYDDSDMQSPYSIVLVYHRKTGTPLLSARCNYNREAIARQLQAGSENGSTVTIDPLAFAENTIMLADRLSGNTNDPYYKKHRDQIFALFYSELLRYNRNRHLILMARSEPGERLLTKYLRIGFHITGSVMHHGQKHWVVAAALGQSYAFMRKAAKLYLFITFKRMFHFF